MAPKVGKDFSNLLSNLITDTAVRAQDFDTKSLQLVDVLAKSGKAEAAMAHLTRSLEGVARNKVRSWKKYIFVMLRNYDADSYDRYQEENGRGGRRTTSFSSQSSNDTSTTASSSLSADASEFIPGAMSWQGCERLLIRKASRTSSVDPQERNASALLQQVACGHHAMTTCLQENPVYHAEVNVACSPSHNTQVTDERLPTSSGRGLPADVLGPGTVMMLGLGLIAASALLLRNRRR